MDFETLFLLAVYLLPLAFVSLIGAWAGNRRPWMAGGLAGVSGAMLVFIALVRPEGMFRLRDIPEMTVFFIARVAGLF